MGCRGAPPKANHTEMKPTSKTLGSQNVQLESLPLPLYPFWVATRGSRPSSVPGLGLDTGEADTEGTSAPWDSHANLEPAQEMFFMLRASPGHGLGTWMGEQLCGDVMLSMCEWTGVNQSLTSALPLHRSPPWTPKPSWSCPWRGWPRSCRMTSSVWRASSVAT